MAQKLELTADQTRKMDDVFQQHRLKWIDLNAVMQKEEAIVLIRRRNSFQILLTDYMLECDLPMTGFLDLKPEDLIQVTIQNVSARKDLVSLTIG